MSGASILLLPIASLFCGERSCFRLLLAGLYEFCKPQSYPCPIKSCRRLLGVFGDPLPQALIAKSEHQLFLEHPVIAMFKEQTVFTVAQDLRKSSNLRSDYHSTRGHRFQTDEGHSFCPTIGKNP